MLTLDGDINANQPVLALAGGVVGIVSIDSRSVDGAVETSIHLEFPDIKSAVAAQSAIKNQDSIKSISIN